MDDLAEYTLINLPESVGPKQTKYLPVDVTIPGFVSNNTKLQLRIDYSDYIEDKNWLRASNFNDKEAKNLYYDDSWWGVVNVSPTVYERALYFRKHIWLDTLTENVLMKQIVV